MRYNSVGSDWDNDELSDSSNDERAELRNRNNGIRSRFFRNNSYNRLHSDDSGDDLDDYVPLSPSRNRSGGNSWLSRKKVAVSSAQSLCCKCPYKLAPLLIFTFFYFSRCEMLLCFFLFCDSLSSYCSILIGI